jgi:hypothetical protein
MSCIRSFVSPQPEQTAEARVGSRSTTTPAAPRVIARIRQPWQRTTARSGCQRAPLRFVSELSHPRADQMGCSLTTPPWGYPIWRGRTYPASRSRAPLRAETLSRGAAGAERSELVLRHVEAAWHSEHLSSAMSYHPNALRRTRERLFDAAATPSDATATPSAEAPGTWRTVPRRREWRSRSRANGRLRITYRAADGILRADVCAVGLRIRPRALRRR